MKLSKRHASFDILAGGPAAPNFKIKQPNEVIKPQAIISSQSALIDK